MGLINLTVYPRSQTRKNANRQLRLTGRTPAVLYAVGGSEARNIELDTLEFGKLMAKFSGQVPIFQLQHDDGAPSTVAVLREMQTHPVRDTVYHCDLMEIPGDKELEMEVGLEVVGESRLVRSGDALIDLAQRSIRVMCLPTDLPDTISMDISELQIGDRILAGDLDLGSIKVVTDPEEVLCKLNPNTLVLVEDEVAEGEEAEGEAAEGEGAEGEKADGDSESGDSE